MLVWGIEKGPRMKGKRYTKEDKIRILRTADSGQAVLDVCREHNLGGQLPSLEATIRTNGSQ